MRVLFAANTPNTRCAGIAKIMNCLKDALEQKGHTVDILFGKSGARFRRLSDFMFPLTLPFRLLLQSQKKGRYDIVAFHSLAAYFYVWLRLFLKRLPPCVVVSYGADEMRWELELEEERLGLRPLKLFSKIFYYHGIICTARFATTLADHVMVSARSEITYFENKYGIPRSRISFIPNGVDPEYFIKRTYHDRPRRLLFLGGWEWRKGTRYLISAFEQLAQEYPDLSLTIAGVGAAANTALGSFSPAIRSQINLIPSLSEKETVEVYAQHDLFVFPSLFESMSLVVPEAMASGLPVVTTRTCGMQDIIEDKITGFLAPPRDANALTRTIKTLIESPELCRQVGEAAQQSAASLRWSCVADQVIAMYENMTLAGIKREDKITTSFSLLLFRILRTLNIEAEKTFHRLKLKPVYQFFHRTLRPSLHAALEPQGVIKLNVNGLVMYLNAKDKIITRELIHRGDWEKNERLVLDSRLRPGMNGINIGANIGFHALHCARKIAPNGTLFAFEPDPSNYELLIKNRDANSLSQMVCIPKAISNESASVELFLSHANHGAHSLAAHNVTQGKGGSVMIETLSLDDFQSEHPDLCIDFILSDAQGAEGLILSGGNEFFRRQANCLWMLEFWPLGMRGLGTDPQAFLKHLRSLGYHIAVVDKTKGVFEVSHEQILKLAADDSYLTLLCTRGARR